MKITCEYCGNMIDDTLSQCPHCGAPNPGVVRTAKGQPVTIEQLKKWYQDRKLPPYETTRFFIGVDYKHPRAFGIYRDAKSGNVVVYKNLDSGKRKIRYEGTDEAYAVNELYQRLKQEIIEQKKSQLRTTSAQSGKKSLSNAGSQIRRPKKKKYDRISLIISAITIACILVISIVYTRITYKSPVPSGYYYHNDTVYYHDNDNDDNNRYWYSYSDDDNIWYPDNSVPEELKDANTAQDFYFTPTWDSSTQFTDFSSDNVFVPSSRYEESDNSGSDTGSWFWDNDSDDSYDWDWDSGDSWDSGGTDWDSDW